MVKFIAGVLLGVVAACSSASDVEVDREHCTKLREHLVDLRLQGATGVDVQAHRTAMREALGDRFVDTCQAQLTSDELQCSLRARDLASAVACSPRK
jgi:hypothetical protein